MAKRVQWIEMWSYRQIPLELGHIEYLFKWERVLSPLDGWPCPRPQGSPASLAYPNSDRFLSASIHFAST
jgi:hypothetical protein